MKMLSKLLVVFLAFSVSGCAWNARQVSNSPPLHTATLSGDYYDIAACVQKVGQMYVPVGFLYGNITIELVDLKSPKTAYVKRLCADCMGKAHWEIKLQQVEQDRVKAEYRAQFDVDAGEEFYSVINPCRL